MSLSDHFPTFRTLTPGRGALLVALLAAGVYANSLGNGFAYDDEPIVVENPVVHRGDPGEILESWWWPDVHHHGLYRPVTTLLLAGQWAAWGQRPLGFHAVSVTLHLGVSLAVLALLLRLAPTGPAVLGAALFAVHPVHVEAVANVVGQAELLAGGFALLGTLLFLWRPGGRGWFRGLRAGGVGAAYLLALGSKEIAVTLPVLLVLLAWVVEARKDGPEAGANAPSGDDPGPRSRAGGGALARTGRSLLEDAPLFAVLAASLATFLAFRGWALGQLLGVPSTAALAELTTFQRILTAVQLWGEQARLLLFPLDLAADYAPGVLIPSTSLNLDVVAGAAVGALGLALVALTRRVAPGVGAGILWVAVAFLPVSHFLFPVGTVLAERTFYLPSVGLSLAVAALAPLVARRASASARRLALAGVVGLLAAFSLHSLVRNPTWFSTYTVMEALARDHPESYRSQRNRGSGLLRVGEKEAAMEAYELALRMVPNRLFLLIEIGSIYGKDRRWAEAEPLLRRAVTVDPLSPTPYRHLASQLILQGRPAEGRAVALDGLARAGPDAELWRLVSESWLVAGDLEAAARARRAALAQAPGSREDWLKLARILEAAGRPDEAAVALRRSVSFLTEGGA